MTLLILTYFLFDVPTERNGRRLLEYAMSFDAMLVLLVAHAWKVI